MPNTNAPMTSDGPIGAIAPPKPGTSAATGTITSAGDRDQQQRAEQAAGLAADQKAAPRGGERELGLEEGGAEREAEDEQRRRGGLPVERNQRDQHRGAEHGGDQERPVEPRQCGGRCQRRGAHRKIRSAYDPKPSVFFRSSHLVRAEASGRLGSEVHSTIEP